MPDSALERELPRAVFEALADAGFYHMAVPRSRAPGEPLPHEVVVLQPHPALGEPDAVLLQERASVQLVHRARHDELVGDGVRHVDVAVRQLPVGRRQPLADDLRVDDVRVVAARRRHQLLERVREELVVVVGEEHVLAVRRVEPDVARTARPAGVRDAAHHQVRPLDGQGLKPLERAVRPSVVDQHDLERARRQGLAVQRRQQPVDVRPRVVDRHDHGHVGDVRDVGCAGGHQPSPSGACSRWALVAAMSTQAVESKARLPSTLTWLCMTMTRSGFWAATTLRRSAPV